MITRISRTVQKRILQTNECQLVPDEKYSCDKIHVAMDCSGGRPDMGTLVIEVHRHLVRIHAQNDNKTVSPENLNYLIEKERMN